MPLRISPLLENGEAEESVRILIVDDQASERESLAGILSRNGYSVTAAGNGSEALLKLGREPFDLLISDLVMPVMDGFELVRRIRGTVGFASMRILLRSASLHDRGARRLARALNTRFISKLVAPQVLLDEVAEILREPPQQALSSRFLKQLQHAHHRLTSEKLVRKTLRLREEIDERMVVEEELRESRQRLVGIIDSAMDAIISIDTEARIVLFNPAAESMFERQASEVIGQAVDCLIPERYRQVHAKHVHDFLMDGATARRMGELRPLQGVRSDGSEFPIEASISRVDLSGGSLATVIVRDISQRISTEGALAASEARMRLFIEHAPAALAMFDRDMRYIALSRRWRDDYHMGSGEFIGISHYAAFPDLPDEWRRAHRRAMDGEVVRVDADRFVRPDGAVGWVRWEMRPWHDETDAVGGIVIFSEEITEWKESEERIRKAALHDPLTGLPNRALVFEYGNHLIAGAERNHKPSALLFVDLDRFKPINDTYGHEVGDKVLQEVARRLKACTRKADLVGRLGGDEFVVLLGQLESTASRESVVAQHLLDKIREPIEVGTLNLSVTPSIGISRYPEHGRDIDTLIRSADLAMYQAKQSGRANYHIFNHDLEHRAADALLTETRLKQALAEGGLMMHYQPVIDIATGRLASAEALVRMVGQAGETISPQDFIPIAESTGLIGPLGEWVATEVCRQEGTWLREGLPPLTIAINVSPLQFKQRGFADRLGKIVAGSGIDPAHLQLEVTESTVMEQVENVIETLGQIKRQGITIALDDFGTGYSSLSLLGTLPLDKLKIDQAFVQRIEASAASLAVTRAIIALAQTLSLEVVGEGVESDSAFEHLRALGCQQAQGYLISRPMPADDFAEWRRQRLATYN